MSFCCASCFRLQHENTHTDEQVVLIELCRQQHHKLSVVMLATIYIRLPFDKGELHTAEQ